MIGKYTFFFTSDIHGRDIQSARLFTLYRELRSTAEKEGRHCLFFDAGDPSDRKVEYCGLTRCSAYGHVLNAFSYDAMTVGNDIGLPYGIAALQTALSIMEPPVLGSNFRNGGEPVIEGLEERIILERGSLKIGVFGLTAPWGDAYEPFGLYFPDFRTCAAEQVKMLKEEGVHIILMLSHMGLSEDLEIVSEVPGIDIAAGGHSHTRTPSGVYRSNGTLLHHCGEYGEYLGRIDFNYDFSLGEIEDRTACLIPVPIDVEPSPEIMKAIEKARELAEQTGSEVIGSSLETMNLDYWHECSLGNFAADALREYVGADIAIMAGGNLNGDLKSGEITASHLNRSSFGTANPCLSTIKGRDIIRSLEKGLDEDLSHYFHHGLRGAPIGIPQICGLEIKADLQREKGHRIREVLHKGRPLEEEKIYAVAHTDLETNRRLGYFSPDSYKLEAMHCGVIVRDVLEKKIRKDSPIRNPREKRWSFY